MKKVPEAGVVRKRGRPPKKQLAIEASTPLAAGEGTLLSTQDTLELDVHLASAPADASGSEKQNLNLSLKSRHGDKSAPLDSVKVTGRKRRQTSSDRASSGGKISSPSSRKSIKDKMKTLLSKVVKPKSRKVSQQTQSSTTRPLSRGTKTGLQISHKKKAKLRKFGRSKISTVKSAKTAANELQDSITTEMKRLLTTDGFWSTKSSGSPLSQSADSGVPKQAIAGKKDSRTSTPDITPSGTRRHSLSKTRSDKDEASLPQSNIPVPELRRLRTTDGFSFREAAGASRTSSRDVSPCSSSSLDRGIRQSSRPFSRGSENKNGVKIDDSDLAGIADDLPPARSKMAVKKESCNGKDKLSGLQKEVPSTMTPAATDDDKFINCESPVSRFRRKHLLDKSANLTRQKKGSANIQSKKTSLMLGTSRRHKLQKSSITAQSVIGESDSDLKPSTSENVPDVKTNRKVSRHAADKGRAEKTAVKKKKGKRKQRSISNVDSAVPQSVLENGSENENVPTATNFSSNSASLEMPNASSELLLSDLLGSAELKRLNTTAGFWSVSGIETVLSVDKPRKLRDVDDISIKEASSCKQPKPARQRSLHAAKFSKTALTANSLLQLRKKKLHSLQSRLMKTEQRIPSDDLPEQQLSSLLSISPAPAEEGTGRKSRPRARLFGVRRQRRNKNVTLNQHSEHRNLHETVGQSFNFVYSEINVEKSAVSEDLIIGTTGSKRVYDEHTDLNSSDIGTKNKETSVLLVAKHDSDTTEDFRGNETSTETVYKEMYSQTMPETSDAEMDTSCNDSPTGLKTLSKKSQRGRRKLQTVDVRVTPPSSVRTRGRRKVNTLDNSLEVQQKDLEPSNEDAVLTSSPATSKVASERRKMKKVKKESLAKIDLPEHTSEAVMDTKLSHPAEVAEIKISETKDNDNNSLTNTETLENSSEELHCLEPSSEDALLASSPATSKIAGEKWKMRAAKKESLINKDLSDHMSEAGMDNKSSHPAEVARRSENDTLTDTKSSTAETDDIEKHVHKDNLFESLGYSLNMPAETSPISCVKSLACDSKDLCSSVSESHFPTVENACEMKLYDCFHVSQTEAFAKHVSDSIDSMGPQQLKDAALKAADIDKEFLTTSLGKLDSGYPDVCHKDSLIETSEILPDLQSVIPSQNAVGSGIISPGSVKSGALHDTSLHERGDNSETSAAVESPSCSEENTKEETDASEKGPIDDENEVMNEKGLASTFEGPEIELDAEKVKLGGSSMKAEVILLEEKSETVTSTSAGIGLFKQFQGSCPQQHLFAEAENTGSYNISMDSNSRNSREQCERLKNNSVDAIEGVLDTMVIKPVIDIESNVDSVAEASDNSLEMTASLQSLCGQHKNTKLLKRKRKQAKLFRRKMRKNAETTDMSVSSDSTSSDVSTVPVESTDDFNSCEDIPESQQNEGLLEANSMVETPVKRARKRKRNSWQRGVLRKVTNVSRKVKQSAKSPSPEQNDMSLLVSNSNDAATCIADAVEKMAALTSALISDVVDNKQTSDNLQGNILLPDLTSDCEDKSQLSASLQPCGQPASAALLSDSCFKMPYVDECTIHVSKVGKKQISYDSKIQISDNSKIQISDDSKIQISDDSKIQNSDDSEILMSDDSKIKGFGENVIKVFNESIIKDSDASKAEDLGKSVINELDASKITDSDDSKIQVLDDQKNEILVPFVASNSETTAPIPENLVGGNEHMMTDTYPPAVTKSLKNMLKKLQTDANLAHADFGAEPYKGKFLRKIQRQEDKEKRLIIRRKLLHADQKVEEAAGEKTAVESQLGISDLPVRKKRGRPRKQAGEALPKLSPVGMLPLLRSIAPWNKTPPDLSPQDVTDPEFPGVSDSKCAQEAEIVSESVDDSDLHLYLSGVSDEEQSPRKEPNIAAHIGLHSDVSLYPEKNDNSIPMYELKGDSFSVCLEEKDSNSVVDTDKPFGAEEVTTKRSVAVSGKEPKKRGRPKKGSRGQPPGIPMTDEERLRRKDEENIKRRKALKAFTKECEDQTLLQFLCTSQTSVDTSDCFSAPAFAGSTSSPAGSFSLRKKSTRSPLVMLAMKRKQEEAQYDMEQERRQARLIHLREKRSARESVEGFSEDEVGEESPENLLTCSVVLNDFVKKLQLDELELSSGEEPSHETHDSLRPCRESPDYNPFDDRNEDWRADFEEHDSEEWNNNRPSIPRLKLKRIIKKGAESQIKGTKLTTQSPKERQHVPIKLVIKTEPVGEPNEQAGLRLGSGESSKVERSGFESSFMDFLKKKSEPLPGKRDVGSKRSYNVSRPAHLEKGGLNGAADLSAVEILSLPTTGIRGALAVNTDSNIPAVRHLSGSTSLNDGVSVVAQTRVGTNAHSSDKVSALENAGTTKPVMSVDEDEDDILILDLEDGAVEQSSDDLPSLSGSVLSASHLTSGIATAVLALSHGSASENHDSHVGNASLGHIQRTYSNDEMGLMFESYNSQTEPNKLDQLDVSQEATDSFVSVGNSEDLSRSIETSIQHDTSQPSNCVFIDSSVKATVSTSQKSMYEVQKSHPDCTDAPTGSSEPSHKSTTEISDSAVVADQMRDTGALNNMSHGDEDTLASCKKQSVEDAHPRTNRVGDSVIVNTLCHNDGLKEGGADSEVLPATSNKTVKYLPSDVSTDSNSVVSAGTSPVKSGCFKKPGPAGDNNKSPKHSAYPGSVPEDWRIKVILHSDKFSSGKYSCKRCSFTAPAKLTIESHIYSHIPGVQFRCAYCESEFSSMAATSSHLKNTHSLNEAKLHISRHIDEKNFYDKETAMFSEESGQQSPVHPTASAGTNAGGQSPPVIISVVVSSRSGRSSSAPSHRFVCTHCGFSTNVKEDAEHHVLDLHSSQALFACLLCSENVCYTESDIKDHCAIVHPARKHPYKKLPDFYDAELLSAKEKAASQDDRENIFERMTSLFHDETQPGIISTIDHRQKAKEYLYLQEGWREKTKVEADSTTAVDYPDEQDDTEEQSSPLIPVPVESPAENIQHTTVGQNEVIAENRSGSEDSEGLSEVPETPASINDDLITSSARPATNVSNNSQLDTDTGSEHCDQQTELEESFSDQLVELPSLAVREASEEEHMQQECHVDPDHEVEDDDGGGMGLKIVQVISLSEQGEDLDEQIGSEEVHVGTDNLTEHGDTRQADSVMPESSLTGSKVQEFSGSEHSSVPADNVTMTEISVPSSVDNDTATSGTVAAIESTAADSSATDNSSASSSIASASFAGGLPLSYKCNACKVHTPYLLMMVKHLKAKHPNMRCFSCPYCKTSQSFISQKQLRHHIKQSHPTKFGRNEIALSEDAKKFVEAMVLPIGPECIRVGNRIVLEEDIHTCTYCQVKMVSLTSVYEHLNTKHSDLFEFVCPECQSYRSKLLPEIFEHCLRAHKASLDTDKVHVSVPKNLFTALTCISKSGKYIEKTLGSSPEKIRAGSSSSISQQPQKTQGASLPQRVPQLPTGQISSAEQHPLRETSSAATPLIHVAEALQTARVMQPSFAVPSTCASFGAVPAVARPAIAFSSSLFDTSSLTSPQLAVASHSAPFIQNAAAASFLSPSPQQAHSSHHQHLQSSKQSHSKPSERTHASAKHLPVLNVPTIRPRTSPVAAKSVVGSPVDAVPLSASNCNFSVMSASGAGQQPFRTASSSSIMDSLPDDEPNPDAFKIFNLCPTGPRISPSPVSSLPPGVPTVFPPVSAPMAAGYIQGPLAGFPPGMVISPNLLPFSFPYSQNQSMMQGLLAQKQNPQNSPLSRHSHLPHTSALMAAHSASPRRNMSSEEATAYLKKHQQRELYLKKQQHHHQQQLQSQRHLFKQSQQSVGPRAHPAHQQPPSLSGQVYQPQPLPVQTLPYDHHQPLTGPNDQLHPSLFSASVPVSSSAGPSGHLMAHSSPSPVRPSKGLHKRSNTLYQCPYCPVMVTLKALEVASHIQQHHPGKQVTFRKIS